MAGQVDMIAACITITEARAKQVLFSAPYYDGGIAVLVRQSRH
jgi:polar amino acid transport system substrate-binding protein